MLNNKNLRELSVMAEIDLDDLKEQKKISIQKGEYLGKLLDQADILPENEFQKAISKILKIDMAVKFDNIPKDYLDLFLEIFPYRFAYKHRIFPYMMVGDTLKIATVNPWNLSVFSELSSKLNVKTEIVLSTEQAILPIIQNHYDGTEGAAKSAAKAIGEEGEFRDIADLDLSDSDDILESGDEEPIKKLVNSILFQALRDGGSDIHIDPTNNDTKVRIRIDGVLHNITSIPRYGHMPVINRIKVVSGLDISTKNRTQDGRTLIRIGGRKVDIRVSILPTIHGERAVLRLLTGDSGVLTVEQLGMSDGMRQYLFSIINQPHGIFLVTGPTGSGKTTTLYASLSYLDSTRKNIVTIEDPVEYQIPGYGQVQVNEKVGLTFAKGLRSILRQDPDVIMLGEIRDGETAKIAIQSALTGHMVFSTLHTNDTCSSIVRLADMGVESFLIGSSVRGILAQRLVRKICNNCKVAEKATFQEILKLGFPPYAEHLFKGFIYRGKGCENCKNTGYQGRIGLFEFLHVGHEVRNAINHNLDSDSIAKAAKESDSLISMWDDAIDKVFSGTTSVEEVMRAVESFE